MMETLTHFMLEWGLEVERKMGSIFVKPFDALPGKVFGTRAQCVYLIDDKNNATFVERFRDTNGNWSTSKFHFPLSPQNHQGS